MRSMEASSPGPAGARSVSVPVTKRASRPRRKASVASHVDGLHPSPDDRAAAGVAARIMGVARPMGAKARALPASSKRAQLLRLLRGVIVKFALVQSCGLCAARESRVGVSLHESTVDVTRLLQRLWLCSGAPDG